MKKRLLHVFIILLLVAAISLSGCASSNNVVPLPTSAKQFAPDGVTLESNQITIPFPYGDKFSNGEEQWLLDRDTSGHLILKVTWRSIEVATFPVDHIGLNQVSGQITLGRKDYNLISITVNNSSIPYDGWVILQVA